MHAANASERTSEELVEGLREAIDRAVQENGGSTVALRPGHRRAFHWPPHPISYSYHVLASDWTGRAVLEAHGERFEVEVAKTPYGVFGRCADLWHEDRGEDESQMLNNLRASSEPLFERQFTISKSLGLKGRFKGLIRDLGPMELVKLLYCPDRDVAHAAKTEIETHASLKFFGPVLIEVLRDARHPYRRGAQWAVLDLFEDLPSFCTTKDQRDAAVEAMKMLLWNAEDDYARTVYKAGVVLGGHLPDESGGPVLLECLGAPSKIGRRSAMHGLFHVVEWHPDSREKVVAALTDAAKNEQEPILRQYAAHMARDIARGVDHVADPVFPDEP